MDPFKYKIDIAKNLNLFDLLLFAKDFIELIDNFKKKFQDNRYFILTASYENTLAGILVAENIKKIDSLEKIIPSMYIHLIYIHPKCRKMYLGKKLLESFLNIQRDKGTAVVYIKLPQNYKKGIKFFLKNNFIQTDKIKNKVLLEMNLWNDYGIRDCQIIEEDFNDMLS